MKQIIILILSMIAISFNACKSKYNQDEQGFAKLQEDMIKKFGNEAYYTAISMSSAGSEHQGYAIIADVTKAKDDLRQERWVRTGGAWQQEGFVNMQVDVSNPQFYKYQLGKEINLNQLGKLIVEAKQKFNKDGFGDNPILKLAIVNTNNTVTDANKKYQFTVILSQSGSEETHSYNYDINGKLIQSN